MTQREVESDPNVGDPNSPAQGPGFVAPFGVGGHFCPGVPFTPSADLYDIEFTNRDRTRDTTTGNRFNVPSQYIPANIPAAQRLDAPDSYGYVSGLLPGAQPHGIATLPGGVPLYKGGTLVGGIGVFFPGQTGYATEENSVLSSTHDPSKPDRSLEAEYDAFAAAGGSSAALLSVAVMNRTDFARARHAPGPLAHAHATWEVQCHACHGPSSSDSPGSGTAATLAFNPVRSERCRGCHSGPPHHASCEGFEAECSTCHREHREREASLVRAGDEHCTRCHSDLRLHVAESAAPLRYAEQIKAFTARDHPAFRSASHDPGQLQFNHARHMTPGMVLAEGGKPFVLAQIPEPVRGRYWLPGQAKEDEVRLQCASCHRPDREGQLVQPRHLPRDLWPPRSAGAYMLPITYESHCQACHPLTFDAQLPGQEIPHRLQPAEVHQHLEGVFAAEYLRANPGLLDRPLPPRPLPGKPPDPAGETARAALRERVERAERLLFRGKAGCAECHHFTSDPDRVVPASVVPTAVPALWLAHAAFSHAAHHALDCRVCHANAAPQTLAGDSNGSASRRAADVLIPEIDTCLRCHETRSGGSRPRAGAARGDCSECRRYHDAGRPLAGPGAAARAPGKKKDVSEFLLPP
jgi:hypothetical protein